MVRFGALISLIFLSGFLYADETVNLSTSVLVSQATINTNFKLKSMYVDAEHNRVVFRGGDQNYYVDFEYTGTQAQNIIRAINTGNFTTTSLVKTIYNQLIADGKISGSVAGTP